MLFCWLIFVKTGAKCFILVKRGPEYEAPGPFQETIVLLFFSFDGCDAGECLPLDGLKQGAAAGRYIAYAVGKPEFVDTGYAVAAAYREFVTLGRKNNLTNCCTVRFLFISLCLLVLIIRYEQPKAHGPTYKSQSVLTADPQPRPSGV